MTSNEEVEMQHFTNEETYGLDEEDVDMTLVVPHFERNTDENQEIDLEEQEETITLTDPITERDLTCDECQKKLSSVQSFTHHMLKKHKIVVIKQKKPRSIR